MNSPLTLDLTGRTALVTGGTGELGRVICRTLSACGADVAVHYFRAKEKGHSLKEEIERAGRRACVVQADIASEDSVNDMRRMIASELGAPDIIVANAVIQYDWKNVLEQPLADYRSQFESCVLHNVLLAKAFIPEMINRKWGRYIAINTECAMQNFVTQSAYVSGKRGMDGVLRVLAREVGADQITVNQVAPGWMISEHREDADEPAANTYKSRVPLRRRGRDQDVANAVAFLSSNHANFISGVYLPVCGGNVMPSI